MVDKPPTTMELAILGLLHQQPRSGYDVRKVFATSPMGRYSSSPGAIYPALRRLESRGLVKGRTDRSRSLKPRRIFTVSEQGEQALLEWVTRAVTQDDVALRMDELMLRFAFMDIAGRRVTRDFLARLAEEIDVRLESLEEVLSEMEGSALSHGRLALQAGIDGYRAHGAWARRALESLESERSHDEEENRT